MGQTINLISQGGNAVFNTLQASLTENSALTRYVVIDSNNKFYYSTAGGGGGGSYVPLSRTLTINGSTQDLSANRSWSVGTVTSITAGTGLTGGTITNSGTVAFDTTWGDARYQSLGSGVTSFNTRTGAVTLLSSDVTGALGYTPVTNARTLTINGSTQDLTANRTWNVGTVTSITVAAGTGMSGGGTITSTGTVTLTNASPDQTVVLNNGTGISVTGTYPNFTIASTITNTNIYNSNGTLSDNRIVTMSGNYLNFTGGNVGINVASSPSYKLDVAGTINSSRLSLSGSYADINFLAGNSSDIYIDVIPGTRTIRTRNYNTSSPNVGATSLMTGNLVISSDSSTTQTYFPYTGDSYINSGNVGIGTTSPATKLQVNGTFASNALWTDGSSISYWGSYSTAYGGLTWDAGYAQVYATSGNNLRLGANGSNAHVYINTSGNVGIGTTSPYEKLEVNGAISAIGAGNNNTAQGHTTTISVNGGSSYLQAVDWGAEYKSLVVDAKNIYLQTGVGSTTSRLLVDSNGNVGIGTTSPIYKFVISNAGSIGMEFDPGTVVSGRNLIINYNRSTSAYTEFQLDASKTTFGTQGNVGINTTSPSYNLDINGSFAFRSTGYAYNSTLYAYNSTTSKYLGFTTDSNGGNISMTDTTALQLQTNGGNVSIGNTGPAYTLDVTGTIRATGDVIAYSDARVKENIKTIESPIELITKLRGVSYTRKDIEDKTTKIGVIAQEVIKILPEVVQKDNNGNYSVAYGNMVGVLIEAIKEQQQQINNLQQQLNKLTNGH